MTLTSPIEIGHQCVIAYPFLSSEEYRSMSTFLKTRVVSEAEYWAAHRETGSLYFIRNAHADAIKIGHSRDPVQRLSTLQVANSARLEIIGLVAAHISIEPIVHSDRFEGHIGGEWFWDRGTTSEWLRRMTGGYPLRRNIWELVKGREWFASADGIKHYWNDETQKWEPPLP